MASNIRKEWDDEDQSSSEAHTLGTRIRKPGRPKGKKVEAAQKTTKKKVEDLIEIKSWVGEIVDGYDLAEEVIKARPLLQKGGHWAVINLDLLAMEPFYPHL